MSEAKPLAGAAERVWGVAPGVDFPAALLAGLEQRMRDAAPEDWGRVELYVNTERMGRRLRELLMRGPARILPRIRLVSAIADDPRIVSTLPPAVPPLRRQLQLAQLVSRLLDQAPDLAPRAAVFDLAQSLAELLDEMQSESVPPETLRNLDVSGHSAHWERSLRFLDIADSYLRALGESGLDPEARRARAVAQLALYWRRNPPSHPVLVAGSTGSRGATAAFMRTVAGLEQGAVVLPGFDFDMPSDAWADLGSAPQRPGRSDRHAPSPAEDHPQFRFAAFLASLDADPQSLRPWAGEAGCPERNALVSLALRPAPVTDRWLAEGPHLRGLDRALMGVTLIEAPSPRAEALAIALRLRQAVELGETAALITPDRMLGRQVTAAMDRWGILPDDSAGQPLQLSAPGRFLRHVAALFGRRITAEDLIELLKHPLTHTGPGGRGLHLLQTRELELHIRRNGPAFPNERDLYAWAARSEDAGRAAWVAWLCRTFCGWEDDIPMPLADHLTRLVRVAAELARGCREPGAAPADTHGAMLEDPAGALWDREAGQKARAVLLSLSSEAEAGGDMTAADFGNLLRQTLGAEMVRSAIEPHPDVMIWGTLEARVQGADLVILGGLNDGTWPDIPPPDPWLNRPLRQQAGLLLPDRRIGLAAHDFQQAVAAPQVVLSRALRDAEAETVPSRWLNRLTNLLGGLDTVGGPEALAASRARGRALLAMARRLDTPAERRPPAPRPSPRPPVEVRPRNLSVTSIQTLIRDPYAIYARHVLGLRALDPLRPEPGALLRGNVLHDVMEAFITETREGLPEEPRALLLEHADRVLGAAVPWPLARRFWRARVADIADWFIEGEIRRREAGMPLLIEEKRSLPLAGLNFSLTGKLDRLDRLADGRIAIFDYKTGTPPSPREVEHFDKQLLLEAAMVEGGAFEEIGPAQVARLCYIGLGPNPVEKDVPLAGGEVAAAWRELHELIGAYQQRARGFTSRRAMKKRSDERDYDHLARFGEWDESSPPEPQEVGP